MPIVCIVMVKLCACSKYWDRVVIRMDYRKGPWKINLDDTSFDTFMEFCRSRTIRWASCSESDWFQPWFEISWWCCQRADVVAEENSRLVNERRPPTLKREERQQDHRRQVRTAVVTSLPVDYRCMYMYGTMYSLADRNELALKLGHDNFSEQMLKERMIGSVENAMSMLAEYVHGTNLRKMLVKFPVSTIVSTVHCRVKDVARAQAERDLEIVRTFAEGDEIERDALQWWDLLYYRRIARQSAFSGFVREKHQ